MRGLERRGIQVRIDLGRGEIRVAEHLLHGPKVCAPLEQVRRKRVAQKMGVEPSFDPGAGGERVQTPPKLDA